MSRLQVVSAAKRMGRRLLHAYQSILFVPAVVCLAILAATVVGTHTASSSLHHDVDEAANARVMIFEQLLKTQLASYEQILRGGVGLFQGSDDVTQQDFLNYLNAYKLSSNYKAVQGIAFSKVFTADQLPDVLDYLANQDITTFAIQPGGPPRDTYAATIYAQLVASTAAAPTLGYDSYSDPARRAAMFEARDTAATTITSLLRLAPLDGSAPASPGFNMYVPYYGPRVPSTVAERQTTVKGYVYASFRGGVLFADLARRSEAKQIAFRVMAGQPGANLYQTPDFSKVRQGRGSVSIHRNFKIYNQTWSIDYAFNPGSLVSTIQLRRPGAVIFFGLFSAFLITTIIWLMLASRAKRLADQKEQAIELAKDELLSLASHQLRTPATGVKQYLGMVLQDFVGKVPRQQRVLLEKAYASNDRQLQSINEILHMAKLNAGHVVLARQQTNITAMIRDVVQEQQGDIEKSRHKVTLSLGKQPIFLYVDPHMLRMATENVLSNAIKYTEPGGNISVKLRRITGTVEIEIRDTGMGINPEDFPKLFKQFSRLPNAMSQHISGTGVGLYLAKNLVELHHGTIVVASALGEGAKFTISLPVADNLEDI